MRTAKKTAGTGGRTADRARPELAPPGMAGGTDTDTSARANAGTVVGGTPQWAVIATHLAVWSVVPSSVWRIAVGVGIPLGWTQQHLDLERIPGSGTVYVISLSVLSIGAAALTFGLIRPWGERVPRAVPLVGGRRLPTAAVAVVALLGAAAVAVIVVASIVHWSSVSGFADRPISFWSVVMLVCYLPAIGWAPLLTAVTVAYVRRRSDSGRPADG